MYGDSVFGREALGSVFSGKRSDCNDSAGDGSLASLFVDSEVSMLWRCSCAQKQYRTESDHVSLRQTKLRI